MNQHGRCVLLPALLLTAAAWCLSPAQKHKGNTLGQFWRLSGIYNDQQHGVEFRYPSSWVPGAQSGFWPPALTEQETVIPQALFGYGVEHGDRASPYSETDLEGFGVVYVAFQSGSAMACDGFASSLADSTPNRTVTFGGRPFVRRGVDTRGMMSQWTSGDLYSTYARDTCYLFEIDVSGTSALDDVHSPTATQTRRMNVNLLRIMQSVRITPPAL